MAFQMYPSGPMTDERFAMFGADEDLPGRFAIDNLMSLPEEDEEEISPSADQLAQIMQVIAPALASAMGGGQTTDRRRTPGMSSPRTLPFSRSSPFQVSPLRLGM